MSLLARFPRSATGKLMAILMLGSALAGCKRLNDVTGAINGSSSVTATSDDPRVSAEEIGKRYAANPDDRNLAMAYARALRRSTQYSQAVAVMQRAVMKNTDDQQISGEYGKALADAGRLQEAADVLSRAHTPDRPNWSILSVQGSVADQLGDHAGAQDYYMAALKIVPNEPTVLSNLGLSYALTRKLQQAEDTLRLASTQPKADSRVRQNLALVLALRGKFAEAEAVERQDLSAADAASNVLAIRRMISQSDAWRDIQQIDGAKPRGKPARTAPAKVAKDKVAALPQ